MKKILTKTLTTCMITAILLMTFQTSVVAATANGSQFNTTGIEISESKEGMVSGQAYPPRKDPRDPIWVTFTLIIAGFVGIKTAETITQNAINNGIDWACNKYKNVWGVKQACKVVN